MVTIYLDKQILSYLYNGEDEKYRQLTDKILEHRDEFIFLYSDAHLLDLQNDKTDVKYEELKFIKSLVGNHRLIYVSPNIQVASMDPEEAFQKMPQIFSDEWIENLDWDSLLQDQKSILFNITDIIKKELHGDLPIDWVTERTPIEEDLDEISKEDVINANRVIVNSLCSDTKGYKYARDKSESLYNPLHVRLKSEKDIDEAMLKTRFKTPFKKFLSSVMKQMGFKYFESIILYVSAYILTDMIGLSPEKRKKVKYKNMAIDGIHSFFASYCDCFVCNDNGTIDKSKSLYKEFNIDTRICDVDEFIRQFDAAIENNRKSGRTYIEEILSDHASCDIIRYDHFDGGCFMQFNAKHWYFGYFDQMIERCVNGKMSIILCKRNGLNQSLLIEEVKILVNRIAMAFNENGTEPCTFDQEKDYEQLMADRWMGRRWVGKSSMIELTKITGYPQLCVILCSIDTEVSAESVPCCSPV